MHDAGYYFGPRFQKQLEVEALSGNQTSRSLVSLTEPSEAYEQSVYPMHPVCIDGCFQTVGPSLWRGNRSTVNAVLVPAMIESIIISTVEDRPEVGLSIASSEYVGIGRRDEMKNFKSGASVYDPSTGALLLQVSGLRYSKLDTQADLHAAHCYSRVDWKPDITFLTHDKMLALPTEGVYGKSGDEYIPYINRIIDLVAHKTANLKIMEVSMIKDDSTSLWLGENGFDKSVRAACRDYHFASSDAKALMDAQESFGTQKNARFSLLDMAKENDFELSNIDFDLVVLRLVSHHTAEARISHLY